MPHLHRLLIPYLTSVLILMVAMPSFALEDSNIQNANLLAGYGIIVDQHDQPDLYRLDDMITRSELVGVALKLGDTSTQDDYVCLGFFQDVLPKSVDAWICRAVEIASKLGYISAENTHFRPHDDITRSEAFAILADSNQSRIIPETDTSYIIFDVGSVDWQQDLFQKLMNAGVDIPGTDYPEIRSIDTLQTEDIREIVFPIRGSFRAYQDTFGHPRGGGRTHLGIDVISSQMTPVVAVRDGVITFAPSREPYWGYAISLKDSDGYTYKYLHINNDTPGTNDGQADLSFVYGPGIVVGARVSAGDTIGYVGNSGNAEGISHHLHFEMWNPDGKPQNPYLSLRLAESKLQPVYYYPNRKITRKEVFAFMVSLLEQGNTTEDESQDVSS